MVQPIIKVTGLKYKKKISRYTHEVIPTYLFSFIYPYKHTGDGRLYSNVHITTDTKIYSASITKSPCESGQCEESLLTKLSIRQSKSEMFG